MVEPGNCHTWTEDGRRTDTAGSDWLEFVSTPMTDGEVEAIRLSIRRDRPFGDDSWTRTTAARLGLESSLRNPGHQPAVVGPGT